jgi:hypothetical protein
VHPSARLDGWVEPSEVDSAWSFKVDVDRETDLSLTLETLDGSPVVVIHGGRVPRGAHAFEWTGRSPVGLDALQLHITADGMDKAFRLRLPELADVYGSADGDGASEKGKKK